MQLCGQHPLLWRTCDRSLSQTLKQSQEDQRKQSNQNARVQYDYGNNGGILASIRGFSTPPLPISMSELLPQIKRHISSRKVSSFFHAINPGERILINVTFTSSMVTPLIPASPFEQLFNDSSTQTRSIFQPLRIFRLIKEPTQTWEFYKNPPLKDHASTSKEEAVNTIEVETSSPPTRRHRSGKEEVMKKFFESVLATPTLIGNTML